MLVIVHRLTRMTVFVERTIARERLAKKVKERFKANWNLFPGVWTKQDNGTNRALNSEQPYV